jgi:hypothetical protein
VNLCTRASAPWGFRPATAPLVEGPLPECSGQALSRRRHRRALSDVPVFLLRVVPGEVALSGLRHERVVRIADVGYGALGYLGHKLIRVQLIEAVARGQPVDQIHVCDSKCVLERPGGTCRQDVLPREGGASSPMQ